MSDNKTMDQIFLWEVAKSGGIQDYSEGVVPFVTSSELNNGVVSYVDPRDNDRVFEGPAICISGLGYATVQTGRFLPKGNGGDSLTIGTPKLPMTIGQLVTICAAFNVLHGWRFSFGRKANLRRLKVLEIPAALPDLSESWELERDRAHDIAERVSGWMGLPVTAGATSAEALEKSLEEKVVKMETVEDDQA